MIRAAFYEQAFADKVDISRCANMLVVRTDGLGDVILTTPLFKHLKATFRHVRTCLLTRKEWSGVLKESPHIDEIIPWDIDRYRTSIGYRFRFIESLKKSSFDLVLHPVYSREPLSDEIVCCVHDAVRIGFDGDLNNISTKLKDVNDRYYTQLIKDTSATRPELERNRYFAERLLGHRIAPLDFQPELWINDSDREAAYKMLLSSGIEPDRHSVIALFPGASAAYKTWPLKKFVELANRLSQHSKVKFIICGSRADEPIANALARSINGPVVNLAGKTSLTQLAAVLECSDLYIGNDTGPLHMATAVGTPTLGIMGGGHFGRFYPYGDLNRHRMVFKKMDCYGCNWKCIYDTTRCIQDITVDDVWREAQRMMEEVGLPSRAARDAKRQDKMALNT